jgi:hypothetical protein
MFAGMISVDLLEAARRSETFPEDWSPGKTEEALRRYEKFLRLAAKHPGMPVAPTKDIDVMWHLHMMSPRAYYEDCQRLFGSILDHDGGFGQEPSEIPILKATFEQTAALWEAEYGEPYYVASGESTDATVKCWHDCQSRCWHACKSRAQIVSPERSSDVSQ